MKPQPTPEATDVLIVDDEPAVRDTLRKAISRRGFRVDVAASGAEGLQKATAGPTTVILTDLCMPEMDGHTLVRRLRAAQVDAAVVIVSGRGDMTDVIEALRLGAVDYLRKPWTDDELSAALVRACAVYAERRERAPKAAPPADRAKLTHDLMAPGAHRATAPTSPILSGPIAAELQSRESSSASVRITPSEARPHASLAARTVRSKTLAPLPVSAPLLERAGKEVLIPSVPSVVTELRALVTNPEVAIDRVVSLVERDQGLLARLLQLGRSPVYSGLSKSADIRTIISRMGLRQVQAIVEAVWLGRCFQVRDSRYLPHSSRLSRHSLALAVSARSLAPSCRLEPYLAYMGGLFADVGASFLLWAVSGNSGLEPLEPERGIEVVREHHEAAGAYVLSSWGHNETVVGLARGHHAERRLPFSPYANLLVVAATIARELTGDDDLTAADPAADAELLTRCDAALGLGEIARSERVEQLRCEYASVLEVLG
jgi:DNA-binding response OmpR family regulator/HD-like signal output (HDOD) protein